jgi:SAM-dependent methyltransferase
VLRAAAPSPDTGLGSWPFSVDCWIVARWTARSRSSSSEVGRRTLRCWSACGFEQIVLSNIRDPTLSLDAENLDLPDESYPVVFAHAALHHCRSPNKAVGEMVRVAQRCAIFVEPNDSWALRTLSRAGYSFPYELSAVVAHERIHGGMRDGPTPNYIYRWTGREVEKTVASYQPERRFDVQGYPYWDFNATEYELENRKESRVASLTRAVGAPLPCGTARRPDGPEHRASRPRGATNSAASS